MRRRRGDGLGRGAFVALLFAASVASPQVVDPRTPTPTPAALLSEIDRVVRETFWDPKLKGVNWSAAVRDAGEELARARDSAARDAVYDRLLARLDDSHTFRLPAGSLPERNWGTCGLRIGREGDGYAVKGVLPGSAAQREGMALGDRVLAIAGKPYGGARVNFRDLFFVLEGPPGTSVVVEWSPARGGERRTSRLARAAEEPGDTLVWKSARVIRRGRAAYGYARLWGLNAEAALAIVELLLDRAEVARVKPELAGWAEIEGFLLDARANSGGYDPEILATFLSGRWSSGDYWRRTREGRRLVPPIYKPLPVALLVNSATASAAEGLALQIRRHGIGPIVGEATAGMATGGAAPHRLSDGSLLWVSTSEIEDETGRSYEGDGITPDVRVADRPPAAAGLEEEIVEAAIKTLASRKASASR